MNALKRSVIIISSGIIMLVSTVLGATVSSAPSPSVNYDYSGSVTAGTIRYISQKTGSKYFKDNYWGNWKSVAGRECGTASISMALSYLGINYTPKAILDKGSGTTYWDLWSGASHSTPALSTAVSNYVNGNGKYSPVIIHFKEGSYSLAGHFVLIVGKKSNSSYDIVDCNRDDIWTLTVIANDF